MALWQHQKEGVNIISKQPATLLYHGMGAGKSYTSLSAIKQLQANFILIVCPKRVIETWIAEINRHTPDEFTVIAPLTGSVAKKAKDIKAKLLNKRDPKPKVVIVNYESCWRPGLGHTYRQINRKQKVIMNKGLFRSVSWDVIVVDECFVADTLIDTPSGSKNIQDLKQGDTVYGYDHEKNRVVETLVKETMQNEATYGDLYGTNKNLGTMTHPYYTQDGYKMAVELRDGTDTVFMRQTDGTIKGCSPYSSWSPFKMKPVPHPDDPVTVYNIETGTSNYFARGVLVHNCHKIKAPGSNVSQFFKLLGTNAKKRIGLSGTPTPNSPLDVYGIYRFLDPNIYGTSYQRFKMRYAEWGGFENRQVMRYINQEEFNKKFYSIAHRVKTEDVIELPEFSDIYVECDLGKSGRKAYDEFLKEAVLEFQSGTELTAANALVKNLRLSQIASGIVKDDDGHEHVIDTSKLETLEELILNIDEPAVIFTRFRSEVSEIRKMIESFKKKGERERTVCQIASGIDERHKFASGEAEICIVNLQSGGTGLNELVRARYAFYYSTGYSSGDLEQSRARIRRPGSDVTKKVLYYHIIARNTMDVVIKNALTKKKNIIEAIMEDFSKRSGAAKSSVRKAA